MKEAKVQVGRFSGIRLVIGVISLFLSFGLARSVVNHWQKRTIVSDRQEALRREQARNQELTESLKSATSAAFIEKTAREKLGLIKEGDTVVLMTNDNTYMTNNANTPESAPNWKKWWGLFF